MYIYTYLFRDGDKMAPSVEKKIAELEMGLLHLQQNIDIPDISLTIHPNVAQVNKLLILSCLQLFNLDIG